MATPSSQKAGQRPISFTLQDLGNGNDITNVSLVIRPEELVRVEPSRLSTQQTLGGAWADNFGVGVRQVNINGHTGWRGSPTQDGVALFKQLNDAVFAQWHAKRAAAMANGRSPDQVQLIFADMLDDFVYIVAPQSFTLRRNKTRPLLMQYQISMTVLSDSLDLAVQAGGAPGTGSIPAALKTLREVLGRIRTFSTDVASYVDGTLGTVAKTFMEITADVLAVTTETVDSLKGSADVAAGALVAIASDFALAGRNIMAISAAAASLPAHVRTRLMEISGAYSYALCLLRNALRSTSTYPDYTAWYGASNCSSLAGGRPPSPLRNENPFERLAAPSVSPVAQTTPARAATSSLASLDMLAPVALTDMTSRLRTVVSGTSVRYGSQS